MDQQKINRRNFLKGAVALGVVCTGFGLGPYLARRRRIFKKSILIMGTVAEIQIVHDHPQKAMACIDKAMEEIRIVEGLMSRFRKDSEIGRANEGAFQQRVALSLETAFVVERSLHWARVTKGAFDPALGKLSVLWDVKHKTHQPARQASLELTNQKFYQKVQIFSGPLKKEVAFTDPHVMLDLGGIAKGYSADLALKTLKECGIEQALVNIGGDIAIGGGKSRLKSWRVGIRDPKTPGKIARVLHLQNQAVATSGNYEQYFMEDGKIYHHILDPRQGRPTPGGFRSVTLLGDNCCDADSLATGLFLSNEKERKEILNQHTPGFQVIELG